MTNKKRVFVSIGAGIFVFVSGSFVLLFIWKLLNSPEWMSTVLVWILVWPTRLLACFVANPYPRRGAVAFALSLGIATDVAILSGIIYATLSLLKRKSPDPPPPPPPPLPFE